MTLWVGTSGWQYGSWKGTFYPPDLPRRSWLEHFSTRFRTVEVNTTFYRLPEAETFAVWAGRVPDDFVFACKLSRYLTHVKRLKDPEGPASLFLERCALLRRRMGPLLMQLPPNLAADTPLLADALDAFPRDVRVAVEFRHDSWFRDDVAEVLAQHGAALCLADRSSRVVGPLWRTAGWGYVRLHEGRGRPHPCYGDASLRSWAERIAGLWRPDEECFVYFDNDPLGCAVRDAVRFARVARAVGLRPTRTPTAAEVSVGT